MSEKWVPPGWATHYLIIHDESFECGEMGCIAHNPSSHVQNVEGWPYHWREDRGIMERICPHGVGHPDLDSARFLERHGKGYENIHGCCGCCSEAMVMAGSVER